MENSSALEVQALTKVYEDGGRVVALDQLSFSVQKGEFLAIQGPSGSGKTTLLNIIGTLDEPTSGRVVIDGTDVATLQGDRLADFRRDKLGFVFQLFYLVPTLTAQENVMLPLLPYQRHLSFDLRRRSLQLLNEVGLLNRAEHLPGQLSGGEQQRVALARALVNRPKLILADEPTGNLDSTSGGMVMDLLVRANGELDVTILLVTHDGHLAARATRRLRLVDGRITPLES